MTSKDVRRVNSRGGSPVATYGEDGLLGELNVDVEAIA